MFTTRISLPKEDYDQERNQWLPRQTGNTGLKFSNGLEVAHNVASRACAAYADANPQEATYTAEGVSIRATGLSDTAVRAILTGKGKPAPTKGQPIKFGQGKAVSHSDESRACQDYYNKVVAGKIEVTGLTATFSNGDTRIEGIQRSAKKVVARLAL
jgi:hypothetical protein